MADLDILHAVRNSVRHIVMDEELTMLIGPATDGRMPEMGVLDLLGEDPVAVHAMPLRPKFHRFLNLGDDCVPHRSQDQPSRRALQAPG